jgi:molybdopterin synthase sulfur carrier subunit
MAITIKLIGALRHASGISARALECEGGSVMDLVQRLTLKSPELRRNLIAGEPGEPRPNALILVNGREISVLNGLETALKDGDEVVFVPVVHGG